MRKMICAMVTALALGNASFADESAYNIKLAEAKGKQAEAGLPVPAQSNISAVLGRDMPSYQPWAQGGGLHAENAQHRLSVDFSADGVEMRSGNALWMMSLRGYGDGDMAQAVDRAIPLVSLNRVEYQRGPLTEWYVNGPAGLEQGFTLSQPPQHRVGGQVLTIALLLSGDLMAATGQGSKDLKLRNSEGKMVLRYTGLMACDHAGRELQSWLELRGQQLLVHVRDSGAQYPLVIDPFVQRAKLTPSDGAPFDTFGGATSISGNTVVIGAYNANNNRGAAYVFVKPESGWSTTSTFTAKLTTSDGQAPDAFGFATSISGDTVVIGAYNANNHRGAAYVFVKPEGGWSTTSTFTAKLTASDGQTGDTFGRATSISGNTVVIGAYAANSFKGTAYVFVQPESGWSTTSTFTAKLTASDGQAGDLFGYATSIGGNTVVIGARQATVGANNLQGAAYVFVQPENGWATTSTFTAKLTASDGAPFDIFGHTTSISGNTVVIGALNANSKGAAYVFVQPESGWSTTSTFTAKLTTSDVQIGDAFGFATSISGNTVVIGAYAANNSKGSAYVFVRPEGGWATTSTFTAKLTASNGQAGDFFGYATSVSGHMLVIGGPGFLATNFEGAAYVFDPLEDEQDGVAQ